MLSCMYVLVICIALERDDRVAKFRFKYLGIVEVTCILAALFLCVRESVLGSDDAVCICEAVSASVVPSLTDPGSGKTSGDPTCAAQTYCSESVSCGSYTCVLESLTISAHSVSQTMHP